MLNSLCSAAFVFFPFSSEFQIRPTFAWGPLCFFTGCGWRIFPSWDYTWRQFEKPSDSYGSILCLFKKKKIPHSCNFSAKIVVFPSQTGSTCQVYKETSQALNLVIDSLLTDQLRTKRRLCPTWGFVQRGEADPEQETGPSVYCWHDSLWAAGTYDSQTLMQTGLQSRLLPLWRSEASKSPFLPRSRFFLGSLWVVWHQAHMNGGKWERHSIIRGTVKVDTGRYMTWRNMCSVLRRSQVWSSEVLAVPTVKPQKWFVAGALRSFIHHKLWKCRNLRHPSLSFPGLSLSAEPLYLCSGLMRMHLSLLYLDTFSTLQNKHRCARSRTSKRERRWELCRRRS